jgi:hypothetical protein
MKIMFTDHVIPTWVTFGIQTLLDIPDINDHRMGEGKGYNIMFNHTQVTLDKEMDAWWVFDDWEAPFPWLFGPDTPSRQERSLCRETMNIYHNLMEHANIPALEFNPIRCGLIVRDSDVRTACETYIDFVHLHLEVRPIPPTKRMRLAPREASGLATVLGHLYTAVCNF